MTRRSLLVLASLSAVTLIAGPEPHVPPKSPWQWSIEERIAARSDPRAAAERVAAHESRSVKPSKIAASSAGSGGAADVIDGARNPELLLPAEVFASLVRKAYLGDGKYQERFAVERAASGLPADFWERLSVAAAPYISEIRAQRARSLRAAHAPAADMVVIQEEERASSLARCLALADALESARAEFGAERFDRYLYSVAAPSIIILSDRIDDVASLRRSAGGCR